MLPPTPQNQNHLYLNVYLVAVVISCWLRHLTSSSYHWQLNLEIVDLHIIDIAIDYSKSWLLPPLYHRRRLCSIILSISLSDFHSRRHIRMKNLSKTPPSSTGYTISLSSKPSTNPRPLLWNSSWDRGNIRIVIPMYFEQVSSLHWDLPWYGGTLDRWCFSTFINSYYLLKTCLSMGGC